MIISPLSLPPPLCEVLSPKRQQQQKEYNPPTYTENYGKHSLVHTYARAHTHKHGSIRVCVKFSNHYGKKTLLKLAIFEETTAVGAVVVVALVCFFGLLSIEHFFKPFLVLIDFFPPLLLCDPNWKQKNERMRGC